MALDKFWLNVRTAARMIRPPAVVADSPRIPAEVIAKRLASADLWLAPVAVRDYDENDFQFLSQEERNRLSDAVSRFKLVAGSVNPRGPATTEQVEKARPAFQQIVELLEFDRFGDAEAFRIGKTIEKRLEPVRPDRLVELRFETGLDSTGDPALWVWVFVSETGKHDKNVFFEGVDQIEPILKELSYEEAPEGRAYLRFRSILDQPAVDGVAA